MEIIGFGPGNLERVTHAEIQGQIWAHLPIILDEAGRIPPCIAIGDKRGGEQIVVDHALKEGRPDDSTVSGRPAIAAGLIVAKPVAATRGEVVLEGV